MDEAADIGTTDEKRQARLERFGKAEIEDSEQSIKKKGGGGGGLGGFKPNRRK